MFDVICLGQVIQDILVTDIPDNALTSDVDTIMAGELIIAAGGDATNEAVMLSKFGDRAALAACLDNTSRGEMLHNELIRGNVDTSMVIRKDECENISTIVIVKKNKEHVFLMDDGRNYKLQLEDFNLAMLDKTRVLAIGSLYGLGKLDTSGVEVILKQAKQREVITIADATFDLYKIGADGLADAWEYLDYFIPSYDEAAYITGRKELPEMADELLRRGVKNVTIKLGAKGCFYKNKEHSFFSEAFKVEPVDTTGCGDAFAAGFIHGLLKGWSAEKSVMFGCASGAINAQALGAGKAIKSEKQVLDFIRERNIKV